MKRPFLVRFFHPQKGARIGLQLEDTIHDISKEIPSIAAWLQGSIDNVEAAIARLIDIAGNSDESYPLSAYGREPASQQLLPPVDEQDVWAAGVTYARSREARQEESVDGGDVYARVYAAERPELFFKARSSWVVGPNAAVGIRRDASWNVPEPELGLVCNPAMEIVGLVIGNDMSSRDIEGENPLYLPQAKVYADACALGPGILLTPIKTEWPDLAIQMQIKRGNRVVFKGDTHTNQIRRRPDELVEYLGRCLQHPAGVVLLTGAGVVPPDTFTLQDDDIVEIEIESVGTLRNIVHTV